MTQTSDVFVKQVVFLTVNHRGPLPLRELHSTDETIVWRDPGGSWACLPPVYRWFNHLVTGCDTLPMPGKAKGTNQRVKTKSQQKQRHQEKDPEPGKAVTQTSDIFVKQVVFLTVNHRGPLPLRELHSTDETIVWRDPGGSWACLPPVYQWFNHLVTGCDTLPMPGKAVRTKRATQNVKKDKTTHKKT